MSARIGHTAAAVIQGRRAFAKGGLLTNAATPQVQTTQKSFFDEVNELITKEGGEVLTASQYGTITAADIAVPDNPELAQLVAERAGITEKRVKNFLKEKAGEKVTQTAQRGLLARRKASEISAASPFKINQNQPEDYRTFAVKLRNKLRQQAGSEIV